MANDLDAFASRLRRAAAGLNGAALKPVLDKVGTGAKKDIEAVIARDAGADMVMSNWRRAAMQIRFDVTGPTSLRVRPGKSAGPLRVLTSGAAPHVITAKPGGLLRTPFGPRPSVAIKHQTRGHGTWPAGIAAVRANTPRRLEAEVDALLGKLVGG